MALEGPLRSSTGSIISTVSSHSDMSAPSADPSAIQHPFRPTYVLAHGSTHLALSHANSLRSSGSIEPDTLRPSSAAAVRPSPASYLLMNPSDIVGPSPVTSVGTEGTEIEDEASDEAKSLSSPTNPDLRPQVSDSDKSDHGAC